MVHLNFALIKSSHEIDTRAVPAHLIFACMCPDVLERLTTTRTLLATKGSHDRGIITSSDIVLNICSSVAGGIHAISVRPRDLQTVMVH